MARLLELQIISTDTVRGDGTEKNPVRRVEQWFAPDGTLVLAYDPHLDETTTVINFVHHLREIENRST